MKLKRKSFGLFNFVLIVGLAVLQSQTVAAKEKTIALNDKNIEYVGRWDKSDLSNYHSYWGGAYVKLKFYAKQLHVQLNAKVNLFVIIDQHPAVLFPSATGLINLTPDSLANGVHTLQMVAKFQNDEIQLGGISLNEGGKLLKPDKSNQWVEFIGDSITSGDRTSKGNISAYPWLCGEALNVQHTQISYCGIPLVSNGTHYTYKGAPETGMELDYFKLKEPNHQPNPDWGFQQHPNVVVINLGTNDHRLQIAENLFQSRYTQFVQKIRATLPHTEIIILIPFNGSYKSQIQDMVKLAFAHDQHLHLIDTEAWLAPQDFVDGTHPKDEGHQIVANKLEPIIKSFL